MGFNASHKQAQQVEHIVHLNIFVSNKGLGCFHFAYFLLNSLVSFLISQLSQFLFYFVILHTIYQSIVILFGSRFETLSFFVSYLLERGIFRKRYLERGIFVESRWNVCLPLERRETPQSCERLKNTIYFSKCCSI